MNKSELSRAELVALAEQVKAAADRGEKWEDKLAQLQLHLTYARLGELFLGDQSAEYIVDFALGWRAEWPTLSKDRLIDLVAKLVNAEGSAAELALMTMQFDAHCIHPAKNGLIYYPEQYFETTADPSPAEIDEMALNMK